MRHFQALIYALIISFPPLAIAVAALYFAARIIFVGGIRLLDGRPMQFIRPEFRDVVDGIYVNSYRTRDGREFLAHNAWSIFRVERKHNGNSW